MTKLVVVVVVTTCVVVGQVCCSPHYAPPQPEPHPQPQPQAQPQPHIVLIVADDLGWNDVSWHNREVVSPQLESLARGGVVLDQSYVQPVCTPSRSALLTGRYPFTLGRQHGVLWPEEPTGLTLNATLLPQVLRQVGYSTHAVGKWHLGFCSWDFTPTHRGFDTFYGYYTGAEDYYAHVRKVGHNQHVREHSQTHTDSPSDTETPLLHTGDAVPLGYDFRNDTTPDLDVAGTYSTYLLASYVEELLSSRRPQDPMFLYLPFQSVHAPLQVPDNYTQPYAHIKDRSRRIKLGMVTALDEAVGRVVAAMKTTGHYNNSVIIFTTDNGGPTASSGNNWPLRGNKTTLWEGGTRGVALVHSPLLPATPRTSHQLVHVTDWLPTLAGLAGAALPPHVDGVDQWGALMGEIHPPRTSMIYNIDNTKLFIGGVRMGDYKLLVGDPGPGDWTPPPEGLTTHDLSITNDPISSPDTTLANPDLSMSAPVTLPREVDVVLHDFDSKHLQINYYLDLQPRENEDQSNFSATTNGDVDHLSVMNYTQRLTSSFWKDLHDQEILSDLDRRHNRLKYLRIPKQGGRIDLVGLRFTRSRTVIASRDKLWNTTVEDRTEEDNLSKTKEVVIHDTTYRLKDTEDEEFSEEGVLQNTEEEELEEEKLTNELSQEGGSDDIKLDGDIAESDQNKDGGHHESAEGDGAAQDQGIHRLLRLLGTDPFPIRLYNLADDPEERHNLAKSHMQQVKVLLSLLVRQMTRYVTADLPHNTPAADPRNFGNVWSPGWCHPGRQ